MKIFDFSKDFDESTDILITKFNDEIIKFYDVKKYIGIITMQYLPNGGIQSLINFNIIIKVNNGFVSSSKVEYKNKIYTSKEFIEYIGQFNLINHILG